MMKPPPYDEASNSQGYDEALPSQSYDEASYSQNQDETPSSQRYEASAPKGNFEASSLYPHSPQQLARVSLEHASKSSLCSAYQPFCATRCTPLHRGIFL